MDNNTPGTDRFLRKWKTWITIVVLPENQVNEKVSITK